MKRNFWLALVSVFILASCGGGGGGSSSTSTPPSASTNRAPIANAGSDMSRNISANAIALDGSGSSDPDGDALRYRWTIVGQPNGANASLTNEATSTPGLVSAAPGEYEIELIVTDPSSVSRSDRVIVTLLNQAPTAQIMSYSSTGFVGKSVPFDASASTDPNGQPLTFTYEITAAPNDSGLVGATFAGQTPNFAFDTPGSFEIMLTVSDGYAEDTLLLDPFTVSAFEIVSVPSNLTAPIYEPNRDRIISIDGDSVVLTEASDGTQSRVILPLAITTISLSPDGKTLAAGHNARVSFVDLEADTVIRTESVSVAVEHIVMDNNGTAYAVGARDSFAPFYSVNVQTGAVVAGVERIEGWGKLLLHPSETKMYGANAGSSPDDVLRLEIENGIVATIDDSAYHGDFNFCGQLWMGPDGNSFLTGCGVVVRTSNDPALDMTFVMDLPVSVTDATSSAFDRTWNILDTAAPTRVKTFDVDTGGEIEGFVLDNGDGAWTGRRIFSSENSETLTVFAERGGVYSLLRRHGRSTSALEFSPRANAPRYSSVRVSETVTLSASLSSDPMDLPLDYEWMLVSQPAGASISPAGLTSEDLSFSPSVAGTYEFSLRVDNGTRQSPVARATVNVFALADDIVHRIAGGVADAEYSQSLNALVYLSDTQAELHILNLSDRSLKSVPLAREGFRVGVGPNGQTAAVSHSGMLSLVDLQSATVNDTQTHNADWGDVVMGNNNRAHFIPHRDQTVEFVSVDFTTNSFRGDYGARSDTKIRHHPTRDWVYGADVGLSPSDFEKWDVAGANPISLGDSPYHGTYPIWGNLWIDEDGARILVATGRVFKSDSDPNEDMVYDGALSDATSVTWADHSTEMNQWAVVSNTGVGPVLYFYTDDFYVRNGSRDIAPIPGQTAGDDLSTERVFYADDGDTIYVLLKGDGLQDNYAVQIVE